MGVFDKLFGRDDEPQARPRMAAGNAPASPDEQAIARYRYMLQTAPPQTLEQAHAEAFARLSPEQRNLLLQQLAAEVPEAQRSAAAGTLQSDPQSLARLATRAEVRQPGTLERSFNGMGGQRGGLGSMLAGSFLGSIAGVVIASAVAQAFFADEGAGDAVASDGSAADAGGDDPSEVADAGDGDGFDGDDFDLI